jgi:enterochelin esterase-like enzyme
MPEPGDGRSDGAGGTPLATTVPGAEFPRMMGGDVELEIEAPAATRVVMPAPGDSLGTDQIEFRRGDTGAWRAVIPNAAAGFHYYRVEVDGVAMNDPGSLAFSGYGRAVSGLEVADPSGPFELRDVPHGELRSRWYRSTVTSKWRQLWVYTPPSYDEDRAARYPVLYLQHGSGEDETSWPRQGRASIILDNLIADGAAVPMLVVMGSGYASPPPPPGTPPSAASARRVLDEFEQLLLTDVVPCVDEHYRTSPNREHRALAGLSMGGRQALIVGMRRLDTFAWLGGLSPAVWLSGPDNPTWAVESDWVQTSLSAADGLRPRHVFLSAGTEEQRFVAAVDQLADQFTRAGVEHSTFLSAGTAHEWTTWRRSLHELAPRLFHDQNRRQ